MSRRDFIARSSALAMGAAVGSSLLPEGRAAGREPGEKRSATVVRVRSENVIRGLRVDQQVLRDMLEEALAGAIGTANSVEAWRTLLKPDDVIGLKFNRSAAEALGTTLPMAEALIRSLSAAGFAPSQLVPIEVPEALYVETGTLRPHRSWANQETAFGSGQDYLAGVLEQVTAIVNVPFLKSHNIAGLTCCLKNLSHALVKHPARFHGNHCSPYIADIAALPEIRDKLRIHIVDALRVVFDGGPEATQGAVSSASMLLAGTDPVAVDTVGLEELNLIRQAQGLESLKAHGGLLSYLSRAAQLGLGRADRHDISVARVQV